MGPYVAETVVKLMLRKRIHVVEANVLIMGLTFRKLPGYSEHPRSGCDCRV